MPVSKKRSGAVELRERAAALMEIDTSCVFVTTDQKTLTLRVWTGELDQEDTDRLLSLKTQMKELASSFHAKIAISDKHPDEQIAFERTRRKGRGKAWRKRKAAAVQAKK